MALAGTNVELVFTNVVAAVELPCEMKTYVASHIQVLYGTSRLLAIQGSDYAIELDADADETFENLNITPTAALITKINALIAGTPGEVNRVVVRRELPYTSDFVETDSFLRERIAKEFDLVTMQQQQLAFDFALVTDLALARDQAVAAALATGEDRDAIEAAASQVALDRDAVEAIAEAFENPVTQAQLAAVTPPTGTARLTMQAAAQTGWVLANDGTIGNAGSGATRANVDTLALFTLIWTNTVDANTPILTSAGAGSTRGVSAVADWAALKRLSLPKVLGRALAAAGTGSGLTARALAEALGEQTHVLTTAELAAHTHGTTEAPHAHATHGISVAAGGNGTGSVDAVGTGVLAGVTTAVATGLTVNSAGTDAAHNNMQPTSFWNVEIKL